MSEMSPEPVADETSSEQLAREFDDNNGIAVVEGGSQFLTFIVDNEEYGVDILRVQAIQGWDKATAIPNTPDYVLGVINLRGAVIPIVELRKRFGMPSIPFGPTTVVIIFRVETLGEERTVGLVVDAVSEVYAIREDEIQPPPDFGNRLKTEFVKGLATVDDQMIIMIDIDKLMGPELFDTVPAATAH